MKTGAFFLSLFFVLQCSSQDTASVQKLSPSHASRKWLAGAMTVGAYGGSFLILNTAWYANYPRSAFHFFNDNGEWLQVDKVGHGWTAYQTSRLGTNLWRWAGVPSSKAVLYGAGSSLLYMLSIEYLDGRSAEWGWSWGDAGADVFGASLYALQEWSWKEQRISLKFSSSPKNYEETDLQKRADNLFGTSFQSRLLKDYNAQTYWLSANVKSFLPNAVLPDWLNLSIGYGAEGMFGGYENVAKDKNGNIMFDRRDVQRYRQWFLAPDVDLTKIKTKSRFLKSVFSAVNVLKFPAPALELSRGKLRVKALAY